MTSNILNILLIVLGIIMNGSRGVRLIYTLTLQFVTDRQRDRQIPIFNYNARSGPFRRLKTTCYQNESWEQLHKINVIALWDSGPEAGTRGGTIESPAYICIGRNRKWRKLGKSHGITHLNSVVLLLFTALLYWFSNTPIISWWETQVKATVVSSLFSLRLLSPDFQSRLKQKCLLPYYASIRNFAASFTW